MNPEVGNVKRKIVKEQGGNKWLNLPLHLSPSVSCVPVCTTQQGSKVLSFITHYAYRNTTEKELKDKMILKAVVFTFSSTFFLWAQAINFNCRPLTTPIPHKTKKRKVNFLLHRHRVRFYFSTSFQSGFRFRIHRYLMMTIIPYFKLPFFFLGDDFQFINKYKSRRSSVVYIIFNNFFVSAFIMGE